MDHGVCHRHCELIVNANLLPRRQAKVVYVASLNDQVVPIYSGLFTAASHPRILRALYIDNDAYQYVPAPHASTCLIQCLARQFV